MKRIKTLYSKQISKVFSLMRKMSKERSKPKWQSLFLKLENAKARAREIDEMRNEFETTGSLLLMEHETVKQIA